MVTHCHYNVFSHSLTGKHIGCVSILLQWIFLTCLPVYPVSFKYMPKSASAWSQGPGTSHSDTARLLFQVIYQLRIHQQCLRVPISPGLPDFPVGKEEMFQCWHSKMVTLVTICLSGLPHSPTNNVGKMDYLPLHQQTSFPTAVFTQAILLRRFSLLTFIVHI